MPSSLDNPWTTDLVALLKLTGPVAAARVGVMTMGLVDAIVVGRYSAQELGFQGLGWALPGVALVAAMGFLSGVQVMTARYHGEGKPHLTGGVLKRGLRYAVGLGAVAGLALFLIGPWLLKAFHLAPGLAEGAAGPLRVLAASLPLVMAGTCASLFLEASGRPNIGLVVMIAANGVNLAVDLVLVPGLFGLPAMGATGSAWATFTARGFLAVVLLAYIFRLKEAKALGLHDPIPKDVLAALEQRRLGYGAGLSQLAESAAFSGMSLIAGWISALAVAGWAVVLNTTAIVFMTPLGLSAATSVLVGRAYGARDEAGVRRAALLGFGCAAVYGLVAAVVMAVFRGPIAAVYTSDPALYAEVGGAMALAGLFFCPDAIQVVAAQALRARADVLVPTVTHIASYAVVMLPLGAFLALGLHLGLAGIMYSVIVASLISAGLLLGRFWMISRRG